MIKTWTWAGPATHIQMFLETYSHCSTWSSQTQALFSYTQNDTWSWTCLSGGLLEPLHKLKWFCQILVQYFQHTLISHTEAAERQVTRRHLRKKSCVTQPDSNRSDFVNTVKRLIYCHLSLMMPPGAQLGRDWLWWKNLKKPSSANLTPSSPWSPPFLCSRLVQARLVCVQLVPEGAMAAGWRLSSSHEGSTLSVLW